MDTIKIDNETIRVADLPNGLQNMVVLYEKVVEKEIDAKIELAIQEAAKMELTKRIVAGYREVKNDEVTAANNSMEDTSDESEYTK